MAMTRVVALAGGVGGAKLVLGLSRLLAPDQLTVIVNTADDFSLYGLAISPDLDTVMYTLAGVADPEMGWGLAGESTRMLDMMSRYGETPWFKLGDRDLATHLLRTGWLAEGMTLTGVTRRLCRGLGIEYSVLPMADAPVRTIVDTVTHGQLAFQEYFVRFRWQPVVRALVYRGAEQAEPSPGVLAALAAADVVVICPSNPILSIAPILAVPGLRAALQRQLCLAVTPIIGGEAVKGPAAKLMRELGYVVTSPAVAAYYDDLLGGFVADSRDAADLSEHDFICPLLVTDTLMQQESDKIRLAQDVLNWAEELTS